jgi:putative ATP-dependent endonuclease of OLD family
MYLRYLQIVNYKNLKATKFDFSKGANTIIGENDSGKSNVMSALRILLDGSYYYSTKRLKESDFADSLGDWKGHWIIISAYFDDITFDEKSNEICKDIIPEKENTEFLKSYIRCEDNDFGTVTLFIRPNKNIRKQLANATDTKVFNEIRSKIKLTDYEFHYTSRSQMDFTNVENYNKIVGNLGEWQCRNPSDDDTSLLGCRVEVLEVWKSISVEFVDALRDVASDLKKSSNPIRRIVDTIKSDISDDDSEDIKRKIQDVNGKISGVVQISSIGSRINIKLNEILGMVYSPDVALQSRMNDDIEALSRHLTMVPANKQDIDLLGLGHLNMLYIALKLVEFETNRNQELMNIMIIEEPEAHIHTHIQKTLFANLQVSKDFTQILMTTHSTHLSEVADIKNVNILRSHGSFSEVMKPTNGLNEFGKQEFKLRDLTLTQCLERYLDAKRTVLLFSKGVILVEGDGEEILIPALVKNVMGVSLDELGIGLINIGSVAFENVACIFHEERLKRNCAIITDMDKVVEGAEKCSENAAKKGRGRKEKLNRMFGENIYVEMFYAPHTLEVDFANIKENNVFIKEVINLHYKDNHTIEKHIKNLSGSNNLKYDTVLTLAKSMGKGWYATVLASTVSSAAVIPTYILRAINFASKDIINHDIILKMVKYSLDQYEESETKKELSGIYNNIQKIEDEVDFIRCFCKFYPRNVVTKFIKMEIENES